MIFDPTHPRKNITLSITGVPDIIKNSIKYLKGYFSNFNVE